MIDQSNRAGKRSDKSVSNETSPRSFFGSFKSARFLLTVVDLFHLFAVYTPHAGPSGYGHDPMGYMMDSQAHMMHRPPGDPGFHQAYPHYPHAEYYGQHL